MHQLGVEDWHMKVHRREDHSRNVRQELINWSGDKNVALVHLDLMVGYRDTFRLKRAVSPFDLARLICH